MYRTMAVSVVTVVLCVAFAGECLAKTRASRLAQGSVPMLNRGTAGGGILARLNKPLVPTMPGLPTASPMGLIAPRISNAMSIFQLGGLGTQAGRLSAIGVLSPRISPVVALIRTPPTTMQARLMYGLTILSPRAAALIGMVSGLRKLPSTMPTTLR
jgi:hypothetical protein